MHTNKIKKETLALVFLVIILIVPVLVNAASIIPCGGWEYSEDGVRGAKQPECDFDMLMKLINNIIDWIIMISIPVAAGIFAYGGFRFMTTGVVDERTATKKMMWSVFKGFVFILAAWLIVTTITGTLLTDEYGFKEAVPVEGVNKSANTTNNPAN